MSRSVAAPTAEDLARALEIVRTQLRPTPLLESTFVLKLECFQPTGSFKVRGALAALGSLSGTARAAGVVTASAGNHGLGVAFAASRLDVAATVVVPATASSAKVAALSEFPIDLVQHGADYAAAERHALDIASGGATYISPYNDTHVIAGNGTVVPEIRDVVAGPITVVVPIGGGGLISGVSLWAADHADVRVVGVEAEASQAVSAAAKAGHVVEVPVSPTLADGLAGNIEPGSITPAIVAEHTHDLVTVSELEIRHAMRYLAAQHGLVTEGSGAVGVAALLSGKVDVVGRPVALVTGRNIDLGQLARVLTENT
jgi:threonine dehydratase